MNKKGLEMKIVFVSLVLLLIFILILFQFAGKATEQADVLREDIECYESVKLAADTKFFGQNTMDIKCPTKNITIKSKEISDLDDLKHRYGSEMFNCWRKMDKGNSNPFSYWFSGENNKICTICSIITTDEKTVGRFGEGIKDFGVFLLKEPIPGKEHSYYEEFTGVSPSEELVSDQNIAQMNIAPGLTYATIFIISQEKDPEQWKENVATGGLIGAGVLGAATVGVGLLVLSFPVTAILVASGVGFGIGAYFGDAVSDYSDKWSAAVMLVPYEYATLGMHCNELGTDPFENPFIKAKREASR